MTLITKSLFVDYGDFPKLAWWKVNDLGVYKKINDLEDEEKEAEIIQLGQDVEDKVGEYLFKKYGEERFDVFEDNPIKDLEDEEDEDILLIQPQYKNKIEANIQRTLQAIKLKKPLIYQAGFMIDGLFVRVDYMRLNENGNYDLIEVKAKTGVRKDKDYQKVKNKNIGELEKKFLYDASFQKYVVNKVLEKEGAGKLENIYFAHLNRDYKKMGELDVNKLIILDQVDKETLVYLKGEEGEKDYLRNDFLLDEQIIKETIEKMQSELNLREEEFNEIHPFKGNKYTPYFGKDRPFGTIYGRGINHASGVKILHHQGRQHLHELDLEEIELFNKSDGSIGGARTFIDNYLTCKQSGKPIVEDGEIDNQFNELKYPLCFYDYESVSVPIPFLNYTGPYQQVVVQYSLHKVFKDGRIEHYGGLLTGTGEKKVEQIEINGNKNGVEVESEKVITGSYKDLLEEFLKDIGEDLNKGSFIVWNKAFENTRNKEVGETFPDLQDAYLEINERTYDLMELFKKNHYFSLDFKGSNSIKYVLPALVPEMSYDGMGVPNGAVAMKILDNLIRGKISNPEDREKLIRDLLLYCGQDSLAMFRIFERVKNSC